MPPERANVTMERNLELVLEETMREPGVSGVICIDNQGLALAAKGAANASSAGLISGVVKESSLLFPDIDERPIITLEGESSNLMIKAEDKITLGIHKVKNN